MSGYLLPMQAWIELVERRLGVPAGLVIRVSRLDVAEAALLRADIHIDGEPLYATGPLKVAAVMARMLRVPVLRFGNLEVVAATAEELFARNGLSLEVPKAKANTYRSLLRAVAARRAGEIELARFLADYLSSAPVLFPDEECGCVLLVAAPVQRRGPTDAERFCTWAEAIDAELDQMSRELGLDEPLFALYPGREEQRPDEVWERSSRLAWQLAGGAVVLGTHGGGTGIGQEIQMLGARSPVLWLREPSDPMPRVTEGWAAEAHLEVEDFTGEAELRERVRSFVERHYHRLVRLGHERRAAALVNAGAILALRRRWMLMGEAELRIGLAESGLKLSRALRLLTEPTVFARAGLDELRALANALELPLAQILAPEPSGRISRTQDATLRRMARARALDVDTVLDLRAYAERRLTEANCRWSLTAVEDWEELLDDFLAS